jgi:hypothetical protein
MPLEVRFYIAACIAYDNARARASGLRRMSRCDERITADDLEYANTVEDMMFIRRETWRAEVVRLKKQQERGGK